MQKQEIWMDKKLIKFETNFAMFHVRCPQNLHSHDSVIKIYLLDLTFITCLGQGFKLGPIIGRITAAMAFDQPIKYNTSKWTIKRFESISKL